MAALNGVFLLVTGLATMVFGLFLFYALLPLFYAFFGFGVGYELGTLFSRSAVGALGFLPLICGAAGAVVFATAAHFLESLRRVLIGVGLGSLLAALVAEAFGLSGLPAVGAMAVGAVVGAVFMLRVFDSFIVVASALGGAGLAVDGARLLFPAAGFLDRSAVGYGAVLPLLVWLALGGIAMAWQFRNLERWTRKAS